MGATVPHVDCWYHGLIPMLQLHPASQDYPLRSGEIHACMAWSWVGLGDAVASYSCELAGFDRVPNPPFNHPLAATENDNVGAGN